MKRIWFLFALLFSFSLVAQDTLVLSRAQSEALFLKENLQLIAQKLQIDQAEAMVLQAKLWPNPTLEIDEVNLWSSQGQRQMMTEDLPWSKQNAFGKHQQFSLSLEQLIQTAGKRKKLVALEEVSLAKSKQYFEDLLRNLKFEFRSLLTDLQYIQLKSEMYLDKVQSVKQLTRSYRRQMEEGHIAQGEYIRLKALELEILQTVRELEKESQEVQKELKVLMHLPALSPLKLTMEGYPLKPPQRNALDVEELLQMAMKMRPDYKMAELDESHYKSLVKYEKAQAIPDINLKVGYDRGGGVYYDFIGFGLSVDLPVFDRNQGHIKRAEIGMDHSRLVRQQKKMELENQIVLAYRNYHHAIAFINEIEPDYENTLDTLLDSYTRNFTARNLSLLEYLDFFEAYMENKEIILEAGKEMNRRAEELNHAIGTDVIN